MSDKSPVRENINRLSSIEEIEDKVSFPTVNSKKLEEINSMSPEEVETTNEDDEAITVAALGADRAVNSGFFDEETTTTTDLRPIHDGKPYGVSAVKLKSRKPGIRTRLGVTTPVKVVLYNSGFLYVTNEIGVDEENSLTVALAETAKKVAIKTAGFSFSSDSLNIDEVVIEFVHSLIENGGVTNLQVESGKTIWDYVSVLDLPTIYLGLVKSINPSTFTIVNACKNTMELTDKGSTPSTSSSDAGTKKEQVDQGDETGEGEDVQDDDVIQIAKANGDENNSAKSDKKKWIKCNTVITADVVPDTLLRYKPDRAYLDRLKKPTLTPEDLKNYREAVGLVDEVRALDFNGMAMRITLSDSSISRYLQIGEYVLKSLTDIIDSVITEEDAESKQYRLSTLFDMDEVSKYAHFIKSITMPDGEVISEPEDIVEVTHTISKDENAKKKFIEMVKEFVSGRSCSIVGIAEYVCDNCKQKVSGGVEDEEFRSIIPLNMQQLFFDIYNLR